MTDDEGRDWVAYAPVAAKATTFLDGRQGV
jgi:hypothetical protein